MKKKKRLALLLLGLMFLTACAGSKTFVKEAASKEGETPDESLIAVGFSQVGAESDWRAANTDSIRGALTQEAGFDLIYEDAQQKQENQMKAVRNFILQEVDYIVLAPIVENGWETVLKEAKDAQIPVILVDRMAQVEEDLYTCWIGSDFTREGENAGRWLARCLETSGRDKETIRIVTLQGTKGSSAQVGRTNGFANVMREHENWVMLGKEDGNFTQAKGREVMERFLENYGDIDAVICENDNMAFGAVEAIHAAGKSCGPDGEIIVISFDAVRAAFDAMAAGDINAVFECNPLHGPKLAEIIRALEAGETVDKIQYMEETYFDTKMDLEQIRARRLY